MKKKLMLLLGAMFLIATAGAFIITTIGRDKGEANDQNAGKIKVVTTFYPIYMIGLNIADQMNELEIYSLTDLNTGCLHDYQLTTKDLKMISEADVMVINGGGMESFLDNVITNNPELTIIDASEGIDMLLNIEEGLSTDHTEDDYVDKSLLDETYVDERSEGQDSEDEHSEDENSEDEHSENEYSEDDEELHAHEHGEYNAHVWLDPKLYMKQIENVRDGLIQIIKEAEPKLSALNSDSTIEELIERLEENANKYMEQVSVLDKELEAYGFSSTQAIAASATGQEAELGRDAVIFHDSFAYLASRAGINVVFTVPLDSDTALSAGDIGKIIDEVKDKKIKYLFTEQQYSDSIAKRIEAETGAKVYIIDSAVTGNGAKESYLEAMNANLEVLKAVIGYQ